MAWSGTWSWVTGHAGYGLQNVTHCKLWHARAHTYT